MNRREFTERTFAGFLSAAAPPLWALEMAGTPPGEEAPESLAEWRLKPGRRVTVATGKPRHRAFPGIEKLRNGDILVVYREGTDHWRTADGAVRLVRSKDGGATWSEPRTLVAAAGVNYGTHTGIAQLSDGSMLLPYQSLAPGWETGRRPRRIHGFLSRSSDNGDTWSPVEIPDVDGIASDYWWNIYGKILEVPDSHTVLWPIARQKKDESYWRTGLLISHDLGRTWRQYRDTAVGLADEKYVIRAGGGRLLAIVRDLKRPYVMHQTESADNGLTWMPYWSAGFVGHCPCLFRTRQGVLLCAHRRVDEGAPRGVGLHHSFDDGRSWQAGEPLYVSPEPENGDCSYPGLVQLESGQVLCVYYTAFRGGTSDIEGVFLEET